MQKNHACEEKSNCTKELAFGLTIASLLGQVGDNCSTKNETRCMATNF